MPEPWRARHAVPLRQPGNQKELLAHAISHLEGEADHRVRLQAGMAFLLKITLVTEAD